MNANELAGKLIKSGGEGKSLHYLADQLQAGIVSHQGSKIRLWIRFGHSLPVSLLIEKISAFLEACRDDSREASRKVAKNAQILGHSLFLNHE